MYGEKLLHLSVITRYTCTCTCMYGEKLLFYNDHCLISHVLTFIILYIPNYLHVYIIYYIQYKPVKDELCTLCKDIVDFIRPFVERNGTKVSIIYTVQCTHFNNTVQYSTVDY